MSQNEPSDPNRRRNTRLALICAGTFFGMVGAAFAAVPLYQAFCQATGFGGTVRRAEAAPTETLGKTVVVRFDANVRDLPWSFEASQIQQTVKIGETKLAFFRVTNHADHPITARAVYNVVPEQAGAYFEKLQCFCFSDQTIAAGATVDMPVLYFVEPGYAKDINTKGKPEITLSYTFYPATDVATQPPPANGKAAS
ncbi:MAG: cytochrome c oxidase assembly protein [Phenylobacterium sp.]|uniref:cytochrome c oxidase assembly protein n=1 Tax=Phenylobacterium sp. TaxID=1871053 RepID=UPI0025EA50ED|nr:cytochrome c oxidase assembly protein [Phenylobacterium sp.]MBI1200070.1 cytochrome c oxidase assembly protein [Phenylobacterium sp.]